MKLVTSKTPLKDLTAFLDGTGIETDVTEVDSGIRMITLTKDGKILSLKQASSYSENIGVLVTPPPKMVEKWFCRGTAFDLPINRSFEHEYQAIELKNKFQRRADDCGESDQVSLEIIKESVEVNDE